MLAAVAAVGGFPCIVRCRSLACSLVVTYPIMIYRMVIYSLVMVYPLVMLGDALLFDGENPVFHEVPVLYSDVPEALAGTSRMVGAVSSESS